MKRKKVYILTIIFILTIVLSLASFFSYMVFGNLIDAIIKMSELKGHPNITKDAMASLSVIWTLSLSVISILITAFFSYLLWKNNESGLNISKELKVLEESGLNISKELKQLEENRDYESKREKALIVYYDLQRGFTILKDLYAERILNNKTHVTKKVFLSENWIENVASLRKDLATNDINQLYNIYSILHTVQSYLEANDDQQKIKQYLKQISDEIFNDFLPKDLFNEFNSTEIEDFISIENYIIMHKLYKLTFNKNEIFEDDGLTLINGVNHSEVLKGDLYNGECILYNSYGNEKIKGHFSNGYFATGTYYGYDGKKELYNVDYITSSSNRVITKGVLKNFIKHNLKGDFINAIYTDGTLIKGKMTEFHDNGEIKFFGSVENGEKLGMCKEFTNKGVLKYEGIIEKGKRIHGKLYSDKNSLIFDGEFKKNSPWNGEIYNHNINGIKQFTGTIKEGQPFKGNGFIFKTTSDPDVYDDINQNEAMEAYEQYKSETNDYDYDNEYDDEEFQQWQINEFMRNGTDLWTEYIMADWQDGNYTEREDCELNKRVYDNSGH